MTKQTVIAEALELSDSERAEVAETLFESLAGSTDPDAQVAWSAELERRLTEIDAGRAKMVPWEEARKQIAGEADGEADH